MDVKNNRKRDAAQIKRLTTSKAVVVNYDSKKYVRMPLKKNAGTGFLPRCKHHAKIHQSITECSNITCFARRKLYLSKRICHIAPKLASVKELVNSMTRTDWEEL